MILLASPSNERLARWADALRAYSPIATVRDADAARATMLQRRPQIVLLDFDLHGLGSTSSIHQFRNLSPASYVVVLSAAISEEIELSLFKAGVRGYCRSDIDPQLLKRVVVAVRLGELWIRRSLVPLLLDQLGVRFNGDSPNERAVVGRLAFLTEREREIAGLVGNGGSNKQIARQLDISERTVKAHLTEIFRKLGIADRLKLALLLANNRDVSGRRASF